MRCSEGGIKRIGALSCTRVYARLVAELSHMCRSFVAALLGSLFYCVGYLGDCFVGRRKPMRLRFGSDGLAQRLQVARHLVEVFPQPLHLAQVLEVHQLHVNRHHAAQQHRLRQRLAL